MDILIIPGKEYIPSYTRAVITNSLYDAFGYRTDYQIASQNNMN